MDDDASYRSASSASSSSDDEYLTSGPSGSTRQDREALVRKKLLESFYGAAPPATPDDAVGHGDAPGGDGGDGIGTGPPGGLHPDEDGGGGADAGGSAAGGDPVGGGGGGVGRCRLPSTVPRPRAATRSDLDSPSFDPRAHAVSHIAHSPAATLLETNEMLALDIRQLDSTMQTLVYENYSKFIDATDAIRSIGTNVGSISGQTVDGAGNPDESAGGNTLARLTASMERVMAASARSENLLRASREAVAEKLRIRRLLTRLDALLSLPATLRAHIGAGRYVQAVTSHASATEILGRHSAGFESLRSIEAECEVILRDLVADLKDKIEVWSGSRGSRSFALDGDACPGPGGIGEVFECAGTLWTLYPSASFSPGLDRDRCRSLALDSCGQLLRERLVAPPPMDGEEKVDDDDALAGEMPVSFLDGILEAATLYGVTFPPNSAPPGAGEDRLLTEFVTSNFDRFLEQVRSILVERDGGGPSDETGNEGAEGEDDAEARDDADFRQVSAALSRLLVSVRELASGLALPEVGLGVEVASGLVDRAVELTETLVRRRIASRFRGLRSAVVRDCLGPLVEKVVNGDASNGDGRAEEEKGGGDGHDADAGNELSLAEAIQLSSVALSDGLQMADDLIRATLSRGSEPGRHRGGGAPVDSAVVKLAVQRSAKSFGVWLAGTLEVLAGCEPAGDSDVMLDVVDGGDDEDGEEGAGGSNIIDVPEIDEEDGPTPYRTTFARSFSNSSSAEPVRDDPSALTLDLVAALDERATDRIYSNFILSIHETCRLAERSITSTLEQSIRGAAEDEAGKRGLAALDSADAMFGGGGASASAAVNPHRKGRDALDPEGLLARRFELASSRALASYVSFRGHLAADALSRDHGSLADARDPYAIPKGPREACLDLLGIVKTTCEDCISVVGGDLFVSPVPPFPEEEEYGDAFGDRLAGASSSGGPQSGPSSGLQLDVERMFVEKTQVYPGPFDRVGLTRNSVASGVLRVALSSYLECVRSGVFSSLGYRQMKVDAIFLRYVVPHFVRDDFGTPEANACTCVFNAIDDLVLRAGQRCFDDEVIGDDNYYDVEADEIYTPFQLVQAFVEREGVMKRAAFS